MRIVSPRSTVLALAVAGVLVLGGCSDNSGGEPWFDPDRADELAHAIMPEPATLPGTGWQVIAEDEWDEPDEAEQGEDTYGGPDGCETLEADVFANYDLSDDQPVGNAKTLYELPPARNAASPSPVRIELEVEIYEDSKPLKEATNALKDFFLDARFAECVNAAAGGETEENAEVGITAMTAVRSDVEVPRNGVAVAFEATAGNELFSLDVHVAIFFWRVGNAGITATFAGTKESMTDEFMNATLARIDGAAIVASKK